MTNVAAGAVERGTVSGGRRRAEKAPRGPNRLLHLLALGVGVLAAGAAWLFLVLAAIDFGQAARINDQLAEWAVTVAATAGAAVCLLLVFVLVSRFVATLGMRRAAYTPRRSSGRSHSH